MRTLPLALLVGCSPLGPVSLDPPGFSDRDGGALRIEPTRLSFDDLWVVDDEPAYATLTVRNDGRAGLVVVGLDHVVGSDAFEVDAPAVLELAPGQREQVEVRFAPGTDGDERAAIFPNGEVLVELDGRALAPVARLLPPTERFDVVPVGCEAEVRTVLVNDGRDTLHIDALTLAGSSEFALRSPLPEQLEPGQQATLDVAFAPLSGGPQSVSLQLASDDPANPVATVALEALGLPGSRVTEQFEHLPGIRADIVFAVDSSPIMSGHLAEAQAAATHLFRALDHGRVDWQVTVVDGQGCHATYDPYLQPSAYHDYTPEAVALAFAYGLNPSGVGTSRLLELAVGATERTHDGD